jgi:uncharacterized membrane protein YtjA (UPF0391 family)
MERLGQLTERFSLYSGSIAAGAATISQGLFFIIGAAFLASLIARLTRRHRPA